MRCVLLEIILGECDMGNWQLIETAPTDKEVLGFQATRGDHEDRMSVCWAIITEKGAFWIGAGGLMPTHWMPLPAPPSDFQ